MLYCCSFSPHLHLAQVHEARDLPALYADIAAAHTDVVARDVGYPTKIFGCRFAECVVNREGGGSSDEGVADAHLGVEHSCGVAQMQWLC